MSDMSSDNFREIFKNDGYAYALTSKSTEPIDINFPNMPEWYKDEWELWIRDSLPAIDVVLSEYNGSNYKLLSNASECFCNEGTYGALFDSDNEQILDMISFGDTQSLLHSLKADDTRIGDDLLAKVFPYVEEIEVHLHSNTEFEYLVFKVLVENTILYNFDWIDQRWVRKRDVEGKDDEQ